MMRIVIIPGSSKAPTKRRPAATPLVVVLLLLEELVAEDDHQADDDDRRAHPGDVAVGRFVTRRRLVRRDAPAVSNDDEHLGRAAREERRRRGDAEALARRVHVNAGTHRPRPRGCRVHYDEPRGRREGEEPARRRRHKRRALGVSSGASVRRLVLDAARRGVRAAAASERAEEQSAAVVVADVQQRGRRGVEGKGRDGRRVGAAASHARERRAPRRRRHERHRRPVRGEHMGRRPRDVPHGARVGEPQRPQHRAVDPARDGELARREADDDVRVPRAHSLLLRRRRGASVLLLLLLGRLRRVTRRPFGVGRPRGQRERRDSRAGEGVEHGRQRREHGAQSEERRSVPLDCEDDRVGG
mmetsp:Transcript_9275/g.38037  ORF Transcript_9275/g.38037 Transcript_9275/m.38037 type:complete len:358 (-) Transcript_9275:612-1685(-)